MIEIWKFYKETNSRAWGKMIYEVSNFGRVKRNGIIIEPKPYGKYLRVCVGSRSIHRIVAELFIPNPENKPCVDHIDTNPLNNRVDNLRWVTYKENTLNPITRKKQSESQKINNAGEKNPMYGRKQTKETKKLISEKARRKRFINNGEIETTVDIDDLDNYINNGWVKGRLPFSVETKRNMAEAHKNTHRVYDNPEHTKWHLEKD